MEDIAFKLSQDKWILRSGGAEGADTAFEIGAFNSFAEVVPEIYLPWEGFGGDRTAVVLAQQNNIPVFNLRYPEVVERFNKYLEE